MIQLTRIFNPSYVCHNMNIFCPASFAKFPLRRQTWKHLRKTLRSHENLHSFTDLGGANIDIH